MAKINTLNYQTVAAWNGSQDLFVVEQPDGTKVATPEQVKQYVLGEVDEVPTEDSDNLVKSGGIFSTMAVPKYDATNRREYFEGGGAFGGNIDSSPTAGSNNAVASGGVYTALHNVETISGSGSYGCTYTAYKYGRVVKLLIRNVVNATTGQLMTLFWIPVGWRPIADVIGSGSYNYGSFDAAGGNGVYYKAESEGGKVITYSYKAFTNGAAEFTYICAE